MRQMLSGLIAAMAMVGLGTVPAMACGGVVAAGCSPCGQAWVSPCGQGAWAYPNYAAYSYHQRLTDPDALFAPPAGRYFYANQGPTFTGPGMWAPVAVYREGAVTGWRGYKRGYYHSRGRYGHGPHHAHRHHRHHHAHHHMYQR